MKHLTTATVTWITYQNYGTFLQAYALQQVLLNLGYDNVILDDSSIIKSLPKKNKNNPLRVLHSLRRKVLCHCSPNYKEYQRKTEQTRKEYDVFKSKYLKIDSAFSSLSEVGERYDIYICGSDQIWYPSEEIFHPYFYLAFTKRKKVAYAPSVGTSVYPEAYKFKVKYLLESFSHIGIRERQGAELLYSFINKPVEVVLDPTLLLSAENWYRLTKDGPTGSTPYILCYFLTENSRYINFVREYAKVKKLRLKIFANNYHYMRYGDECIFGSPERFLTEIRYAEVVFTDSFHATIFSIHFERDFYTFKRFNELSKINQNSRLINLFSELGIKERFLGESELEKVGNVQKIDYATVSQHLERKREDSMSYLVKSLCE